MLVQLDPFSELLDMQRRMSQLVRGTRGGSSEGGQSQSILPPIDVFSRDGDLVVRAELPGIDPEKDVTIEVQGRTLMIRGERRQQERIEYKDYVRIETAYGTFNRTVPLPDGVNPDDIRASYRDGILEVVVPNAGQMAEPKRVPIEARSKGNREAA